MKDPRTLGYKVTARDGFLEVRYFHRILYMQHNNQPAEWNRRAGERYVDSLKGGQRW